jgi:DNA-directed RNA polymerase specialized sigma24 family protein
VPQSMTYIGDHTVDVDDGKWQQLVHASILAVAKPAAPELSTMMTNIAGVERSFAAFVETVEPRLRRALVLTYGPLAGREACADALSWGWEHWDRLRVMTNPVGYLYRVGRTSARQQRSTGHRVGGDTSEIANDVIDVVPELWPAVAGLSEQQRVAVVLVHGYGYRQTEVADTLGIAISTLREHLNRGTTRLRQALEVTE